MPEISPVPAKPEIELPPGGGKPTPEIPQRPELPKTPELPEPEIPKPEAPTDPGPPSF